MVKLLDALGNAETRRQYLGRLRLFEQWAGCSPEAFVELAQRDPPQAQALVERYVRYLKGRYEAKEVTAATIRNRLKPLKLLCVMNDVAGLNWAKLRYVLPKMRNYANDRAPRLDEVRTLLQDGDPRLQIGIMLMCSAGLRIGAFRDLTFRDLEPIQDERGEIAAARVVVYRSHPEEYVTFTTPETWRTIERYREYREAHGEKINGDSPLLRDLFAASEPRARGLASRVRRLKTSGLKRLIERALWTYRIRTGPAKRHEFQAAHGFRKFFKSRAEQVMKPANVEVLMGHSLGVSDSYYRPTEAELLADYRKAVPLFTIRETVHGEDIIQIPRQKLLEMVSELVERKLRERFARTPSA